MFCVFTRPRYQVSVYRTIGHLVSILFQFLFVLITVAIYGFVHDGETVFRLL